MEAKISLLEKLPDSMLTDVKPDSQNAATSPGSPTATDEKAALEGASHTKIETFGSSGTITPGTGQTIQPLGSSVAFGDLVESKLAVDIMDSFLPSLFVVLLHYLDVSVKKTELQLTEKEKNTLSPIMKKCLDTLMINFSNPWATLGIALLFMYGSKVTEKGLVKWLDGLKDKPTPKPETKLTAVSSDKPGVTVTPNPTALTDKPSDMIVTTPAPSDEPFIKKHGVIIYEREIKEYAKRMNKSRAISIERLYNKKTREAQTLKEKAA